MGSLSRILGGHSIIIVSLVCSLILIYYLIPFVNAQTSRPELYSSQSKPYGRSYSTWIVNWTQWLTSISKDKNPADDPDGRNCSVNQQGTVWFLAGTFGGPAVRTC